MLTAETGTLTVAEAAAARRSVRKYKDQPVPEADLREILRITGLAPSAFNAQPWRFVVVRDPALKEQLRLTAFGQAQVGAAPAVVVLYSDMKDVLENTEEFIHPGVGAERIPEMAAGFRKGFAGKSEAETAAWGTGQSYIALGYLLLAAQSLGYGTSPMLGFDPAAVKRLLDLPEHATIPALVALGVPDEDGFPHYRHETDAITAWR